MNNIYYLIQSELLIINLIYFDKPGSLMSSTMKSCRRGLGKTFKLEYWRVLILEPFRNLYLEDTWAFIFSKNFKIFDFDKTWGFESFWPKMRFSKTSEFGRIGKQMRTRNLSTLAYVAPSCGSDGVDQPVDQF